MDYNTTIVILCAALMGAAAGTVGVFLLLRQYALLSDAMSHATLPGIGLGFLLLTAFGVSGRHGTVLSLAALLSAGLGVWVVHTLERITRLSADTAIAVVLSVFFGFGVVLLTLIQTLPIADKAGLEAFLVGSGAALVQRDAVMIAIGAALTLLCVMGCYKQIVLLAFDPLYARTRGMRVGFFESVLTVVALLVTVLSLHLVGLILSIALLIIPSISARLWTNRPPVMLILASVFGAGAGVFGAVLSAVFTETPTGATIVLVCFGVFLLSVVLSPKRGVVAVIVRTLHFRYRVHLRQGVLALAYNQPIFEPLTHRILRKRGFITADGVATQKGQKAAVRALVNEQRWHSLRQSPDYSSVAQFDNGVHDLDSVLTRDQIRNLDRALAPMPPVDM